MRPRREPGRDIRGGGGDAGAPFDEFIAVAISGRSRSSPDIGSIGPQAVGTSPAAGGVLIRLQVPGRRPHAQGRAGASEAWSEVPVQSSQFTVWCHRVPWSAFLHGPGLEVVVGGRLWVLRLLLGLPAGVDVGLQGLVETVANALELDLDEWLPRALAAAFLDPLVALGVADIRPPPPHPGASLRLGPRAATVIGSALVAAGEEVSLTSTPGPRRNTDQGTRWHQAA